MRGMKAGKLRHRVRIDDLVTELDSDGDRVEVWAPAFGAVSVLAAEIIPNSGREYIAAETIQSKVSHRIKIRHRDGLKPNQRAVELRADGTGDVFNIEAVLPDPESGTRWVTLMCSAGVTEGI